MTPLNNLPGTVEVFLPNFGVVAGIPVVGEAEAGFDVAGGGAVGRRSGCG